MHGNRQQFTTMANIRITYRAFRKSQMLETHPDIVTQNLWDEAWVCLFICPFFFFKASQEVFPHPDLHP